ncbi:MAG: DUF4838 domain-containing protein [Lentisphaeria bacterium]|nr:DUF4838 domain-containing protein [Lentisphaeria bacterium]
MKRFLALLLLTAVLLPAASAKTFQISRESEGLAGIVVDLNAPRPIQHAARELQNYFKLLSNARISIYQSPVTLPKRITCKDMVYFIPGTPDSVYVKKYMDKKIKAALKKIGDTDGYAVFIRGGNKILIVANQPRGVINGVHRFIHKHTDFIWFRPRNEAANFTFDPDLKLDVKEYIDIPKFTMRGWAPNRNIAFLSEEFELFASRLSNNFTTSMYKAAMGRRMDHAFAMEFGGGHNISTLWLPKKKYAKTNPEYYMLINGERKTEGPVHLCWTNPEMKKEFIKNVLAQLKTLDPIYTRINIMIDDVSSNCQCKNCEAPIKLPDGRTIDKTHEAFRSTQFFIFLNDAAKAVYAVNPKMQIKSFGYYFTSVPPEVKIFPTICVSFCPYVRNDKRPITDASNTKWHARTIKYAKMSPSVMWREYYFSQAGFPRAQANVIATDLRWINKLGIKMFYCEASWGDRPAFARPPRALPELEFFDITGAEFWVINQLLWDPEQDPDKLRNEYVKRTYKEAAPGVQEFYQILRDSWYLDPSPSSFNDDFRRTTGRYIIYKNLTGKCRAALAKAALAVKDPVAKKQLARLSATFERWITLGNARVVKEQIVPRADIREFPGFDFDSGIWKKAAKMPPMTMLKNANLVPPEPTDVKLIHNGETFYVAYRCPFPGEAVGQADLPYDRVPSGDHGQIFIANSKDGYYHLRFGCRSQGRNGIYDGRTTDGTWNTKWEVRTQLTKGEWRAVIAIPFKSVNINIERNNRVGAMFYRCRPKRAGEQKNVHSVWDGGDLHNADSFGDLIFKHE